MNMAATMRRLGFALFILLLLLGTGTTVAADSLAGYYGIQCSEPNATVVFDGGLGTLSSITGEDGTLEAVIDISSDPPLLLLDQGRQFIRVTLPITLTVEKDGFYPYETQISRLPDSDEQITLPVYLCKELDLPSELLWTKYTVNCAAEGAAVYFDEVYAGSISAGTLTVWGNSSEPYSNITVEHEFYKTYYAELEEKPGSGEQMTIGVVLERREESDFMLYFLAVILCCIIFGVFFEIFRSKHK